MRRVGAGQCVTTVLSYLSANDECIGHFELVHEFVVEGRALGLVRGVFHLNERGMVRVIIRGRGRDRGDSQGYGEGYD